MATVDTGSVSKCKL